MSKLNPAMLFLTFFLVLSITSISTYSSEINEKEIHNKVNQNLIRVRNFLLERRYRIHKSVTSLIGYMEKGTFQENPEQLYSQIDNLVFYLKSHNGIPFLIENNTVPFLEEAKRQVLELRNAKKEEQMRVLEATKSQQDLLNQLVSEKENKIKFLERSVQKIKQRQSKTQRIVVLGAIGLAILFSGITFFIGILYGRKKYSTTKTKTVHKIDEKFFESVKGQSLISLDRKGNIEKFNSTAEQELEGSLAPQANWNEYVEKYFYRDTQLEPFKGYYRNRLFPRFIYKMNYSSHFLSGSEIVQLVRFDMNDLVSFSRKQIKTDFIQLTYETFDAQIDKVIQEGASSRFLDVFNLLRVNNGADYLYLNELEAKKVVKDYLSIVNKICLKKAQVTIERLKVSRDGHQIKFEVTLKGDTFNSSDLDNSREGVKVAIDSFRNSYGSILEGIDLKNIFYQNKSEVHLVCVINDLFNYVNTEERRPSFEQKELNA
ncbi:MAG: hypothetical protein NXH75_03250 [Halobacteriovoraceae bacterium]|nr:hypothetical protein [Halobacteriovoraceae bacterium]